MTTNYTTTQEITTVSVTLTDFTITAMGLGLNVHGSAFAANVNNFDIGPTTDSNILLQTLDLGNHHVYNGICHDSHTPSGPAIGVHGIYDKAFGSLIEQIDFHHHPNGQGYSPRYANLCRSCVYHDTPYCIGLFNYQGASVGSGGALRLRDQIMYSIASGGYMFYSDGIWRAADGTILGDSTMTVELDHITADCRGVGTPFGFQDCHNDVYLTNSIIISDSGLPLSSIITPPSDGSTVHLDGSIVMSSADAATYLDPAPSFAPLAVGGSPVIGTAGSSPPGVFAAWGNEADLGAAQSGTVPPPGPPDPPPPPPPPPGPGPDGPSLPVFDNRFRAVD